MRSVALLLLIGVSLPARSRPQRLVPPRQYHSDETGHHDPELDEDEDYFSNSTDKGTFVGAECEQTCSPRLLHVVCNPATQLCECEKKYPVKLNPATGCSKPKRLGDQCWYKETCKYSDSHSSCIQVHHNAVCQCISGYHSVSLNRPSKKLFCAEDLEVMTTDFSTLAGVISGIAVLSGLICFVLKLFNQNLYPRRHRYGNAHMAPPILFNSDAGSVPTIIDRRTVSSVSRASSQRTLASATSRRPSSAPGCRPTAASRAGSRRPSIASVHSSNSIRSYSMRRYEKEREQKEEREMQKRLVRLQSTGGRVPATPSPHSTDDLLPTLEEDRVVPLAISEENASTSFQEELPSTSTHYHH